MTRWVPSTQTSAWVALLAGVLPLWLLGLAVSLEGFPAPPVPPVVGLTAFFLALILGGVALWRGWLRPEIAVVSLFPLLLVPLFDEITTTYKTPFIFACATLLSAAIGGLQAARLPRVWQGALLLAAAVLTLALAGHAVANFWDLTARLGYHECFPDAFGCAPLPADAPPWWALFLS